MATLMVSEWSKLLLAREMGTKLPERSSPMDSSFEFPVLKSVLQTAADAFEASEFKLDEQTDEQRKALVDAIDFALKKIDALRIACRTLLYVSREGQSGPDGVVSEALRLPNQFYSLVKNVDGKVYDEKKNAAELEKFDAPLAALFGALLQVCERQRKPEKPFWQYRLHAAIQEKTADASAQVREARGYWLLLDPEPGEGDARPRRLMLPGVGPALLAIPGNDEELRRALPKSGARVIASVADPRTLAVVARRENVRLGADLPEIPADKLVLDVWEQDPFSELSRAASALRRFGLEGDKTSLSLWDAALELDPPADSELSQEKIRELSSRREQFDARLRERATDIHNGPWQVGIDVLSAAVWARRLQRAAGEGLAYLDGDTPKSLPEWGKPVSGKQQEAKPDSDTADSASLNTPPDEVMSPTVCAYYAAVRLGAGASSSARSLELGSAAAVALGVAGTMTPPELVYVRASDEILARLPGTKTSGSSQFAEWFDTRRPPNSHPGRALTPLDVVTLAGLMDDGLQNAEDILTAVARAVPPSVEVGTLDSPDLQRALVSAMAEAFRDHRQGGMPAILRQLGAAGLHAGANWRPAAPEREAEQGPSTTAENVRSLVALLGKKYGHRAQLILECAAAAGVPMRGSRDIVRLGRARFVGLFKEHIAEIGEQELRDIYARAWTKVDARAQFIAIANETSSVPGKQQVPQSGVPNLESLFQQTDLPSCSWGASIHGPAAYLADTLEFLRHRLLQETSPKGQMWQRAALDLLLEKRPDLAEIDLSAPNAEVEMPFIDLVCELLEREVDTDAYLVDVRHIALVESNGKPALDPASLKALQAALVRWGLHLGTEHTITPVPPSGKHKQCGGSAWILRDAHGLALSLARTVEHHGRHSWRVDILPQSTLPAAALMSEPQYVGHRAYDRLGEADLSHGYGLPWSFGESMLREHLALVGLQARDLIDVSGPAELTDADTTKFSRDLAALGISQAQGRAIFEADKDYLILRSGERDGSVLSLVTFLERSELTFSDVRALEETQTFGAAGFRIIGPADDPCGADTKRIKVQLPPSACGGGSGADVLGKFLRLKRALGWSVDQLDRALQAQSLGKRAINRDFAHALAGLAAMRNRLQMHVDDSLALFNRLRTASHAAGDTAAWQSVFLDPRSTGADSYADSAAIDVLRLLSQKPAGTKLRDVGLRDPQAVESLVTAALRIPSGTLAPLIVLRFGTGATLADRTLDDLSHLYGVAVLMRALQIPPAEFAPLVALAGGLDVFKGPDGVLHLCDLRQGLSDSGLSAQSLYDFLSPALPPFAGTPRPLPFRSREQAVLAAQSLHAALEAIDAPGARLLLPALPPDPSGLASWIDYLRLNDAYPGSDVTTAQALAALAEPIRRLLPRFEADRPRLRSSGEHLHTPAGLQPGGACAASETPVLLSEALPSADRFDEEFARLERELPDGLPLPRLLVHGKVCDWVKRNYAPALQWAGLPAGEVEARLRPWMEASWTNDTADPIALAGYLLARPLFRRQYMLQREETCMASLADFLGAAAAEGWALAQAMPVDLASGSGTLPLHVAQWLSELDTGGPDDGWVDPLPVALELAGKQGLFGSLVDVLLQLARAWQVMRGLDLGASALAWLEGSSVPNGARRVTALGALSVPAVPAGGIAAGQGAGIAGAATAWLVLAQWAAVFKAFPDVDSVDGSGMRVSVRDSVLEPVLAPNLSEAGRSGCCRALAILHGLSTDVIAALLPAAPETFAAWLKSPSSHTWIDTVATTLARTGSSAAELAAIAKAWDGAADESERLAAAASLRRSLRKRFDDDAWRNAIANGQNRLRTQKRDALVACLLGDGRYASIDEIYESLLIDTQMAPCMTTSRIVQAHAAVQQFVQRCLMGIESGWEIPIDEMSDWKQWDWMKNFRVWEAARKIFLYPENAMEPEFRDDKSPFFVELESDLNQGELTNENAEMAFLRYLHKLHQVARLDVVATYYEFDPVTPVMHVLGRTPSEPRRYYYRQWVDERRWTPWEPVDVEIDGNQLLMFQRAGRLYVGWMTAVREEERQPIPTSFSTTNQGGTVTVENKAPEPLVRWKLQLSTSERAKEGWQAKRVSPDVVLWPRQARPMSEIEAAYQPASLQLIYQDFGVPEILVMRAGNADANGADGNALPLQREQVASFVLSSCMGLGQPADPEQDSSRLGIYPLVNSASYQGYRYVEYSDASNNHLDLVEGETAIATVPFMKTTPGRFSVTLAQQATPLDLALAAARSALVAPTALLPMTMGIGLPIFYADDSIDIAIRSEYRRTAEGGTTWTSRTFGRMLGQLRAAFGTVAVQDALDAFGTDGAAAPESAAGLLAAVSRAAPMAGPGHVLDLLRTVGTSDIATGNDATGQTFHVAARNHHPLACEMVRRAEERGVAHVFSLQFQLTKNESVYRGRARTGFSGSVSDQFGTYALAFDPERDAYADYNWEAFFHGPYTIAMRFAAEAKFEDAIRWFHYIFDPTAATDEMTDRGRDAPLRSFWKTQPFYEHGAGDYRAQRIDVLLNPARWGDAEVRAELQRLANSIVEWRRRPNIPFQLGRARWVAFQKAVVYRYIETLISWGDNRFRIDTREEITVASQLYILAGRLLGRRPRTDVSLCGRVVSNADCGSLNYDQLTEIIDRRDDDLSVHLEQLTGEVEEIFDCSENEAVDSPHLNFYNEYFCIPPNEKLFGLWDLVADRLYKVRHCQNIDGITRSLALFAPPIDPALLARAGAAGLSFDQIMAGLNQPRSHYRFATMIQKANEVAGELRVLGNELLQSLEKRDAEELALLRSRLELQAIRLNTDLREQQVRDAEMQIASIDQQLAIVATRRDWYARRVGRKMSPKEAESIETTRGALMIRTRVGSMRLSAAIASMLPESTVGANGAMGSPHFALKISGTGFAAAQNAYADMVMVEADREQTGAGIVATLAAYERRDEDWALQRDLADGETTQLGKQRLAAEIRLQMAIVEKRNLEKSIESAEATDAYLKSKFTNAKLYDWMVRQVSTIYFKTYQMALDLARSAEDCLNRELPLKQSGVKIIQPGYWDGLRKGLMAASTLIHDLKRLELEAIQRNRRTPELTKHISLAIIDPLQLMELRARGICTFRIPEALFDLDHPGQFGRRIRAVSISIPCITGPYIGVSCELSLMSNEIRLSAARSEQDDASNLLKNPVPAQAIYTSSANNDSGQFELNLRDERYLPFEGAGAINSDWQVKLPGAANGLRQFDYASISDVVLQIRYTAEPVSAADADLVSSTLAKKLNVLRASKAGDGMWLYASLRADLAEQFHILTKAEQGVRKVRVQLPAQLMRWMGMPVAPLGGLVVRVNGQGTNPSISISNTESRLTRNPDSAYLGASFDSSVIDGSTLISQAGFELTLKGIDILDDVLLMFRGELLK